MKHSDPYALRSSPRDLVRRDSLRPRLWVIGRALGKAPQQSTTDPTAWTNHDVTFGPDVPRLVRDRAAAIVVDDQTGVMGER